MVNVTPYRVKTISEFHRLRGQPKPEHPLVSVVNFEAIPPLHNNKPRRLVLDFYSISIKRFSGTKFKYGQQDYDFDEGVMFFMAPGQVFGIEEEPDAEVKHSGWGLLIHSDFLWNTPLAKTIQQYEYFDYSVNEALFLSEKEEAMMTGILQAIQQEYHSNMLRSARVSSLHRLNCCSRMPNGFISGSSLPEK